MLLGKHQSIYQLAFWALLDLGEAASGRVEVCLCLAEHVAWRENEYGTHWGPYMQELLDMSSGCTMSLCHLDSAVDLCRRINKPWHLSWTQRFTGKGKNSAKVSGSKGASNEPQISSSVAIFGSMIFSVAKKSINSFLHTVHALSFGTITSQTCTWCIPLLRGHMCLHRLTHFCTEPHHIG